MTSNSEAKPRFLYPLPVRICMRDRNLERLHLLMSLAISIYELGWKGPVFKHESGMRIFSLTRHCKLIRIPLICSAQSSKLQSVGNK